MENLPPPPEEKKLPAPHEKLLRSPTFLEKLLEKQGKAAKWLAISSIIFFLLLLDSALIVKILKPKITPPTQTPISTDPLITSTLNPTANWKTYKSSKMNFSIKVPANFNATLDFEPLDTPSYNEINSVFFVKNADGNIIREVISVDIESWTNYFNSDTNQEESPSLKWIDSDIIDRSRNNLNFKKEEFTIDNNPAIKISSETEVSLAEDTEKRVTIYSIKGNRIYVVNAYIDAKQQNYYLPIFNQILSTFKFLDQTPN